jgi:hypothetical protein
MVATALENSECQIVRLNLRANLFGDHGSRLIAVALKARDC